jgi:serine-type D-Ala-D-Ala carboxypeptidase/endopeptidase (penicillin-binding protein 4)
MKNNLTWLIHFVLVLTCVGTEALGVTKNQTRCFKSESGGELVGDNTTDLFTLASVTKVFTTHWALAQLGSNYRYKHQVYITPVAANIFDVHIEGSQFPYFDKTMFQFLVSELNRMNVKRIRFLTYDENFEYASVVRTNSNLAHQDNDQNSDEIMRELRRDTGAINASYSALKNKAQSISSVNMADSLQLSIDDIHLTLKSQFQKNESTIEVQLSSSPMHRILKEMNRNSHNFASDKIFNKLSEKENFSQFLSRQLNISPSEFIFYNGSGYPIEDQVPKLYNKASCETVVSMMFDLRKLLSQYQLQYQDILPMAGKDSSLDGDSTVTQLYGNATTNGALIAKTGTVADTIALAGLVMTTTGNYFFHISEYYDGSLRGKNQALAQIRLWIDSLYKLNGGPNNVINYSPIAFLPFDHESGFSPTEPKIEQKHVRSEPGLF